MNTAHKELSKEQISQLIANSCRSSNWKQIKVSPRFDARFVADCTFDGDVLLGETGSKLPLTDNTEVNSGLYHSHIINCNIGDNCYINNTSQYISNQEIGSGVIINGCSRIEASENCSFGNGTKVATINEGGGREVVITDLLSSQVAYLVAMYRHRPKMIEAYESMTKKYVDSIRSTKGIIESDAKILGAKIIKNSRIGSGATIDSAALLSNCSINSSIDFPSYIGIDVKIEDSIISAGAKVDSGAMLSHCFVSNSAKLAKSFFAEHSLFFSGSDMALGEACAIFAGPFTVSHHRSTLLIAGMFSFFNAGSGANQSNHMYRTGPVHQGIHRRGCKFGSNAYLLSPALTGAFTLVSGNHKSNHETEIFPFSYLIEEEGKSYLMPGANLRSYGTARDCKKWIARDRRSPQNKDIINFDKFSPYIMQNIYEGLAKSKELLDKHTTSGIHTYNRVKIKDTMLRNGVKLYNLAINIFLSQTLSLEIEAIDYSGQWVDMAGMVAPQELIEQLLNNIESQDINTLEQLERSLCMIDSRRENYTKGWGEHLAKKIYSQDNKPLSTEQLQEIIAQGQQDLLHLESMNADDAKKDSATVMSTGYGADNPKEYRSEDFANIRAAQTK